MVQGEQGTLYYQVIHNRIARQQGTCYRVYAEEWDARTSSIVLTPNDSQRTKCLLNLQSTIDEGLQRFRRIVHSLEQKGRPYTADEIIVSFQRTENQLFEFMQGVIASLKKIGKIRTSETYVTTLNSFKRFREDRDLALDDMDSDMMMAYEAHLKNRGVSPNSSSFYMRNLRAVYNRAVQKGLVSQRFPFKYVYTGVDKTAKRAVPLETVRLIRDLDLTLEPALDLARDLFMFSFYTRGMSFIDMAYLKKSNLKNGILSYRRQKTGQQLFIKWEEPMQEIVNKYDTTGTPYLLPVIRDMERDVRRQYKSAAHRINHLLKRLGKQVGVAIPLTTYVARHGWASIAKSKNIPISIISEAMGHDSEKTTLIYLASLDTSAVDKANSIILKSL